MGCRVAGVDNPSVLVVDAETHLACHRRTLRGYGGGVGDYDVAVLAELHLPFVLHVLGGGSECAQAELHHQIV